MTRSWLLPSAALLLGGGLLLATAAPAADRHHARHRPAPGPPPAEPAPQDRGAPAPRAPGGGPAPPALELAFVGDILFGQYGRGGYVSFYRGSDRPFAAVAAPLRADVLIGNLETPLSRALPPRSPVSSRHRFGAPADRAALLRAAGFTAVSVANNHAADLRLPGLIETPAILREAGVAPLGAAVPRGRPPLRVETLVQDGARLGFLAATARRNLRPRPGDPALPYVETHALVSRLRPVLKAARADHDLLAVLLHWGQEYHDEPTGSQRRAARALIDAGADLVIGHHPHVLQGVERYRGGLIAYSLGNFLFANTRPVPRLTGVLRVTLRPRERCLDSAAFVPAYLQHRRHQRPVPTAAASGSRLGESAQARLSDLSQRLGTRWEAGGALLRLPRLGCPAAPAPAPAADLASAEPGPSPAGVSD